ncbi:MAG: DNA repair exonuclease SbcCD nuclease subunit [Gammaproteobacteria bacterium]|jgi:DNA repair exonuclease SbcCD nuclease subunit
MTSAPDHVRFIHSSDWQLGMTRAFLGAEAAARFAQARIDAITTLGQLAQEHAAQFIVVAGDVFESNQLSRQTLMRTLDALQSLSVPIFLLPGNHDPLNGASIFSAPEFERCGAHIKILRDNVPVAITVTDGAVVEVVGAPWRSKHPNADLCAELAANLAPTQGIVRVAVAHGQVDSLAPDTSRPEIIGLAHVEAAMSEHKFHYLALGDRHSVTQVGNSGRVWYSGAPVATAFDEVEPNKALLVDLSADGDCSVQTLAVGAWTFIVEHRALNDAQDLEQFAQWLMALPNKERSVVKVSFEGSINLATAAALDELLVCGADLFAALWLRRRTSKLVIVPDQLDQDSVSLTGYARRTWDELLSASEASDPVAQDALRLFYRLSGHQAG